RELPLLAENLEFRRLFRDRYELVPYEQTGSQHAGDAHRGQSGEPPFHLLVLRLVRRPPSLLVTIAEHAIGDKKDDGYEHDPGDPERDDDRAIDVTPVRGNGRPPPRAQKVKCDRSSAHQGKRERCNMLGRPCLKGERLGGSVLALLGFVEGQLLEVEDDQHAGREEGKAAVVADRAVATASGNEQAAEGEKGSEAAEQPLARAWDDSVDDIEADAHGQQDQDDAEYLGRHDLAHRRRPRGPQGPVSLVLWGMRAVAPGISRLSHSGCVAGTWPS